MTYLKNEQGSALILVLFLVLLISALSIPLLLATSQGYTNSHKGENGEKAYYIAESGAAVLKRALYEAIVGNGVGMDQAGINQAIAAMNSDPPRLYNNSAAPVLEQAVLVSAQDDAQTIAQTTLGSFGIDPVRRTKSITQQYLVVSGNSAGTTHSALFGKDVVSGSAFNNPEVKMFENYFVTPNAANNYNPTLDAISGFDDEFDAYFNAKMAGKPAPLAPLQALDVPLSGYSLASNCPAITQSQTGVTCQNDIVVKNGKSAEKIVINGDLVSAKSISFPEYIKEIEINGNLLAGEAITLSNYQKLTVNGSIVAGGKLAFNGASEIKVAGTISSKSDIGFGVISTSLTVGSSIVSSKDVSFGYLAHLNVASGSISGGGGIAFNGAIGSGNVGQSIIAGEEVKFGYIGYLTVGQSISGKPVAFADIGKLTVVSGSIISGSNATFGYITDLTAGGSISSAGSISFQNIGTASIGGSLYAPANLNFQYITDLYVGGSIYAGNGNGSTGLRFNGVIGKLAVVGTMLSTNKIDFPYIGSMTVGSFIGTKDKITFNGTAGSANNIQVKLGGITSGNKVDLKGWHAADSLLIAYNPPSDVTASKPSITFGNWTSR